jgi:hypothetical protein
MDLTNGGGSALASWTPVVTLLSIFGVATVALLLYGRSDDPSRLWGLLRRIPNGLSRLTGVPGWAAATVGMSLFGLLVAGQGFYDDVSWHVALGRDEDLFTAPHTAIVVGLALIAGAAAFGIVFATLDKVDVGFRWGGLRVPWSCALLGALGLSAVAGFPLDDVWHAFYGVDVTMWSPTHMLMICGAALTGAASWLVLQEAGVPVRGRFSWRALHVLASWFAFQGLIAPLGEFAFGVPQFDQVFHPLLLLLAGGVAVVAMRLVLGPWWALGITAVTFLSDVAGVISGDLPAQPKSVGMYVGMAAVVELVALVVGTERRTRFAIACGLGLGTAGLATEWLFNQTAYQPWRSPLLLEALLLGIPMAVAASFLGLALAGRRPARGALAAAAAVVLVALAWPMPRPVGDVTADLAITPLEDGFVEVEATLTPADAADDARWFQVSSWQGGDLLLSDMEEVAPGRWVSQDPVPVGGNHKSIVRLHRGHQMMAVPVFLPADEEIGEPEIPAEDRTIAFGSESTYLLRETEDNDQWLAWAVYGLLGTVAVAWLVLFGAVTRRVVDGSAAPGGTTVQNPRVSGPGAVSGASEVPASSGRRSG